jgi:Glycosyl transferase family 2
MLTQVAKIRAVILSRYRQWAALRAAARGDHISALRFYDRAPAQVRSALGLHASLLSTEKRDPAADPVSFALAAAELGDTLPALRAVAPGARALSVRDRERLALAIGRWAPNAAISLTPVNARLLNSALALRAGKADLAARLFPKQSKRYEGDHDLVASGIATARADHRAARRLANQAFVRFALQPPLDPTLDAPITLASFGCGPLPLRSGPLVSVIMPARNAEKTIAIAIKSVLAQTWQTLELIVVDDASTDGTSAAAVVAIGSDRRARILRRSTQGGAYAARNDGLRQATGVFATFNDADDWSHPQRIAHDVKPLLERPELCASASRLVRLREDGQFTAVRVFPLVRSNPASLLFRRDKVIEALGEFEEVPFGADEEFTARLTACFGVGALLRQKTLLSVASAGSGSLTGSVQTGVLSLDGVRARIAYREGWHHRHIETYRGLLSWRMQHRKRGAPENAQGGIAEGSRRSPSVTTLRQ